MLIYFKVPMIPSFFQARRQIASLASQTTLFASSYIVLIFLSTIRIHFLRFFVTANLRNDFFIIIFVQIFVIINVFSE